jgi:predicted transcriptional regulator
MSNRIPRPTDAELQVLSVLWEHGPATAREVLERMPDGKQRTYTTVLTIMQLMEKKGLLKRRIQGRAHVYRPGPNRSRIIRPMIRDLITKAFGGNPAQLVQQLLADERIDAEQLDEIRKLLDEAKDAAPAANKASDTHTAEKS